VRGTFQDVTEQRAAESALLATRERLVRERRAVEVLQETLIHPGFPSLDAFDIAARYLPAEDDSGEIGGDWYDAFLLPDGRVMLAVGDVSGHGLSAARLMEAPSRARAYAVIGEDLGICSPASTASSTSSATTFNRTLLLALEPDTGKLEFVSAGHPPPLQVGEHEGVLDVRPGPLGCPERAGVVHVRSPRSSRATLLFYTDGLVERNEPRRSLDRLRELLSARPLRAPTSSVTPHPCASRRPAS
jgi:serine phosphatase RsbU (regulator of sigma subunit)